VEVDRCRRRCRRKRAPDLGAYCEERDRATVEALVAQVPVKAARNRLVEIPRETEAALVLAMIWPDGGFGAGGDAGGERVAGADGGGADVLDAASDTSTRDGWNQWVWLFSRSAALTQTGGAPLRLCAGYCAVAVLGIRLAEAHDVFCAVRAVSPHDERGQSEALGHARARALREAERADRSDEARA